MIDLQATLTLAATYAVLIVATVEALRRRVALDGWRVLAVAGVVAVALVALFVPAYTLPELLAALRTAALAWLIAVGGDAWLAKLATKSRLTTVVESTPATYDAREAPTMPDRPTVPPEGL